MRMDMQELLHEIERICRHHQVRELYLFGSYATGTATPTSDVDIVVKGVRDMDVLQEELDALETLKKIDIFDYDSCKSEQLKEAMDRYGRKIYGAL